MPQKDNNFTKFSARAGAGGDCLKQSILTNVIKFGAKRFPFLKYLTTILWQENFLLGKHLTFWKKIPF